MKAETFVNRFISPRRGIGSSCRVGVTPLRRNYTSGLRWPRVPQPWMLSRLRSPNSPYESKCFSSSYFPSPSLWLSSSVANASFLTFTICFFYWFVTSLSNVVVFTLILIFDASVCIFVLFAWLFLDVICHLDAATPVKSLNK